MRSFSITNRGSNYNIVQHTVGGVDIFQVSGDNFAPIIIVKAEEISGRSFWATMPEDPRRHRDAQVVGEAITEYLTKQHVLLQRG